METIDLRRLVIRAFHVKDVVLSDKFSFSNNILTINKEFINDLLDDPLIVKVTIDVIRPGQHDREINTIMDIIPMSVKALGSLGEGITFTLTGAYVMLTGVDEDGRQMYEFGSSEGILSEQMKLGKAGTPGEDDLIIHVDVLVKGGLPYSRELPMAAFSACDRIIQEVRLELKKQDAKNADEVHEFYDRIVKGGNRVAIVKQVAGQGAMYDNLLFPNEPSGYEGGVSIIDLANMPVVLSPNEYRDGILRSMV
ncbi:MAG: proline reductase cluster protein PrdD [Tissierellia bacterium]|nr:proline reductase cluster protein PrdD [Tissierellia bacterium]